MVKRRYCLNSLHIGRLIITANQPFSQWDKIFPDFMMTVAAADRVIHHAHIIEIERESYRKKTTLEKIILSYSTGQDS